MEETWSIKLERQLVQKAKNGSTSSFELLMDHYIKNLYNYIHVKVSNEEDVKDLIQETMLGAYKSIQQFNETASVKTWLIGISRRKIADYYRNRYKKDELNPVTLEEVEPYLSGEDGNQVLERLEVTEAIEKLPIEEKELVHLIFVQQLTYNEIGELTGLPIGTIKSRIYTIKGKLKSLLK